MRILVASCLMVGVANAEPANRVGIDGSFSIGLIVSGGGELRGEVALGGRHAMTFRAEWLKTQYIFNEEEEGGPSPAWNLFGGYIGDRAYWGNFYLDIAVGVAYLQRDDFVDDVGDLRHSRSATLPGARLGLGGKIDGRLDLGLELMFPAVGLGFHVGIDFLRW